MDKIILKNMRFFGHHGVFEDERRKGQDFLLDIEIYLDLDAAGETDRIENTIDYTEIYSLAKRITEECRFRLIEGLADCISKNILSRYEKVKKTVVRVRKKPDAVMDGDYDWVEVEVQRSRNGGCDV